MYNVLLFGELEIDAFVVDGEYVLEAHTDGFVLTLVNTCALIMMIYITQKQTKSKTTVANHN